MGAALPGVVWMASCVGMSVYAPLWDTHAASLPVKTVKGNKSHIHETGTQTPPGSQTAPGYAVAAEGGIPSQHPTLSDQVLPVIPHEEGLISNLFIWHSIGFIWQGWAGGWGPVLQGGLCEERPGLPHMAQLSLSGKMVAPQRKHG